GTQHGVYMSYDDGEHWAPLSLNLPDLPVVSLEVRENSIAIATHGRGFYVLDDIAPLQQYGPAIAASTAPVLFEPATAIRSSDPAKIQYWLRSPAQKLTVEIQDEHGTVIQSFVSDSASRAAAAERAASAGR